MYCFCTAFVRRHFLNWISECQLLGGNATCKMGYKIYSLQFSRMLRLIYYPIQTKTSKIVVLTLEFGMSTALCVSFMILVSLENVKKYTLGGCTITSKTKINVFDKNFSLRWPFGAALFEIFSKNVDFSL